MTIDPLIALVARGALAALMLAAAVHKLRDLAAFRQAVEDYRLLPAAIVPPAVLLVPLAEATAGIAALLGNPMGLFVIAGLLMLYAIAIGVNLRRGRSSIDCGCFGFGKTGQPINALMVTRNAVLAAIALSIALADVAVRPLLWLDWLGIACAIAAVILLYGIMEAAVPQAREIKP